MKKIIYLFIVVIISICACSSVEYHNNTNCEKYIYNGIEYWVDEIQIGDKAHEYLFQRLITNGAVTFNHYASCKYCEYYKVDPNLDVVSDARRDSLDGYYDN